jgi:hypothetical protein
MLGEEAPNRPGGSAIRSPEYERTVARRGRQALAHGGGRTREFADVGNQRRQRMVRPRGTSVLRAQDDASSGRMVRKREAHLRRGTRDAGDVARLPRKHVQQPRAPPVRSDKSEACAAGRFARLPRSATSRRTTRPRGASRQTVRAQRSSVDRHPRIPRRTRRPGWSYPRPDTRPPRTTPHTDPTLRRQRPVRPPDPSESCVTPNPWCSRGTSSPRRRAPRREPLVAPRIPPTASFKALTTVDGRVGDFEPAALR